MVDLLTAEELEEYNYFKSLVIPMLSKHGTKSMTYHDIKEKLEFLITKTVRNFGERRQLLKYLA